MSEEGMMAWPRPLWAKGEGTIEQGCWPPFLRWLFTSEQMIGKVLGIFYPAGAFLSQFLSSFSEHTSIKGEKYVHAGGEKKKGGLLI